MDLYHTIPIKSVEEVISDGERNNKITKEEADKDEKSCYYDLKRCWDLPKNKVNFRTKEICKRF